MSCFIVTDETIDKILRGLERASCQKYDYPPAPRALRDMGEYGALMSDELTAFGRELLALNVRAFNARYEGRHQEDIPDEPYTFTPGMPPTPIVLYKALQCFLYQCSEGDVPQDAIYQELSEWRETIADHIVTRSKEYEAAVWG